jgi:DNA/RNA-binding protein KIN17
MLVGTPKYLANKMKSKGLQRLRWFCQVCEKQCRDENGFKCHAQSEAHLRQMLVVGENAGRHIADFSSQFQHDFVQLLSRRCVELSTTHELIPDGDDRFGTKRVFANRVYQEFIGDKSHMHMNSTRWVTLTEFCKHLGRCGIARVDETEKGWFIAWIDNSPKALAKQEASMAKERLSISDEQRERNLIAEQIERAKAEVGETEAGPSTPPEEHGLKREEGTDKVVLSFSAKPTTSTSITPSAAAPATGFKMNPLKSAANPLKANPLKRPNVFKTAAGDSSATQESLGKKRDLSAAEAVMLEDQERKRRRMERDAPAS